MGDNTASALERLRQDHQEVLVRLEALGREAKALADVVGSRPVPVLYEFLAFIEDEVWTHFRAEEEALFPLIRDIFPAENAPIVGGPVYVLTEEHSVLRRLVARLKESLAGWENDERGARDTFLLTAPQTVRAFQKHIYKEDNIVFRLAETHLSPEDRQALETAFNRIHPH